MKRFFENLYKITRVIIIIAPFVILGILIKKDLVLSGHLEFTYNFKHDSPALTNLFPANRLSPIYQVKGNGVAWQQILQEPVYFETRIPQKFATATLEITYQNTTQPLVQVGLRNSGDDEWNYDFKPLENQLLDNLPWFKMVSEQGTIWQKEKKFLTREQFLANVNSLSNIAAINYKLPRKFFLPNYRPQNVDNFLNKTLRGKHSFYTYIKNEALDFSFIIQDINRTKGPDPILINVYNELGQKINQIKLEDDGHVGNLVGASIPRTVKAKMAGLPEGVYRLELVINDDIFIRQIKTKQQYLTFINSLYLGDSVEYSDGFTDLKYQPTAIYSTMPRLGFYTSHPAGLQTIGINNNQSVVLDKTHQNYFITAQQSPVYIYSPKNDLKIFGQGLMAFSQEMFFNPEIYNLKDLTLTPDIDYIISDYQTPVNVNGFKTGQVTFSLANAAVLNRKLRFAISAPELNTNHQPITLQSIKVIFDREPMSNQELIQKVFKYIKERF
ncbi:MAG: hypothetical protein WCV73_00035 [Patescibacteria group bacterium]|jgi:hypothetical protein